MKEARYQENGFQLATYQNRRPDPYTRCETCDRPMHHIAAILDEWGENHSSLIQYYFCANCDMIHQQTTREAPDGSTTRRHSFQQPPAELLVEILAVARQQNGRGVTLMTINRRWWAPHRYPLFLGSELESDTDESAVPSNRLEDDQAPGMIPLPRYTPVQKDSRNPFISRRKSTDEASDSDDTPDNENSETL